MSHITKEQKKFTESIKRHVVKCLTEEQWSPEQIVGKAKKRSIQMVSCERIYQFITDFTFTFFSKSVQTDFTFISFSKSFQRAKFIRLCGDRLIILNFIKNFVHNYI